MQSLRRRPSQWGLRQQGLRVGASLGRRALPAPKPSRSQEAQQVVCSARRLPGFSRAEGALGCEGVGFPFGNSSWTGQGTCFQRRTPNGCPDPVENGNASVDRSFSCIFRMHLDEALVRKWRLQCMLRHGITGDGSGVRKIESKYPVTWESPWLSGKESAYSAGDRGSISGSGRSPGGGHGNPLQYPCLENPMDRGAW